ncbi:hypothetical protein [Cypionkella sp.]|jgi:hypothetical protein|uniref:hypothetical protein n=1 Tax=Cypionkella sp. TaxID=2811411 RepID=UPI003751061B
MQTRVVRNCYVGNALHERWDDHVWKWTPALIMAIPFPGGVFFGAEGREPTERVGFFMEPHDARIVAGQLLKAAEEAENDLA